MKVCCKFRLDEINIRLGSRPKYEPGTLKHIGFEPCNFYDAKFSAVYPQGPEDKSDNRKFWEATPSGTLVLTTLKMMPWEGRLGEEFYVDIVPASSETGDPRARC